MAAAIKAVCEEVNAAGGISGKKLEVISEDDATNPEVAVRAARKLIDVDGVCAILGAWSSAVATAIAPLCWESKTFLGIGAGADSITKLPHLGYVLRANAISVMWAEALGGFAVERGVKRLFFMAPQSPYMQSQLDTVKALMARHGGVVESLVYDDKKPSYRSEIDQALRFQPDGIIMAGYAPDSAVLLKDFYRANFKGQKFVVGFALNQKMIDSLPPEVVEGVSTASPSPNEGSAALTHLVDLIGVKNPDHWTCQCYDLANLTILAIAKAGATSGTAIKDTVRIVSQAPDGMKVENALDGLRALAQGKSINYEGASSPCTFNEIGDIVECRFRYDEVKAGKITLVKLT
jgi:branched-chain amino acid transport system substrate-binding protein